MAAIKTEDFFKKKRNTSEIKSEVFVKYFKFWCGVLLYAQKFKRIEELLYIDLFAGPGYYENSNDASTPIKILDSIYQSNGTNIDLNKAVKTFFNDEEKKLIEKLDHNISSLKYYKELINKPVLLNEPASKNLLSSLLQQKTPSLTFIDPFGYSYSMEMLLQAVREWGSDLFMLFNINRIRAAINNKSVEGLMNEIFQHELNVIKDYYNQETNPTKREEYILERFEKLFKDKGYYLFKFRINFPDKNQTSHYLYLVSKVRLAYFKIKDIMKVYSEYQPDGVPIFAVNVKSNPIFYPDMVKYSIQNLENDLMLNINNYVNKTIEMIYEEHSINTNYIKGNYKQAIENLWNDKKIGLLDSRGKESKRITYNCTILKLK